ncbi:COG0863 DNA modification methylase [uncultured Caudovirales phage]|uniref:site-specific DNA-methyltransferase (cytosine-N(4)-specific) n=1 Tax=uncultured Caudovirales phage TaxID=2100421 RepID=A0A6J5LLH1_9CAUD|nr:COG0863 DNA modification methylase [uncultured Caudovirales phage]
MNIIEFGDCRETMRSWAAQSIKAQTCITSPPYFGLRDYGHDGQIGLEDTPEQYISAMVEVFRCVRDVLADDGTLWVNIGDSYASYRDGKATPDTTRGESIGTLVPKGSARNRMASTFNGSGIKHKDLIGIPWMLAFALRADGWYLRQDIIWHKPNPMPESVRDRCTKAHEYIFLFSKQAHYYFNNEAIKEPVKQDWGTRDRTNGKYHNEGSGLQPHSGLDKSYEMANKRSVWSVNTKPYSGAHFAVYPEELISPCVLAGSRAGDIVLDPFMGSGTTAALAIKHGRRYLGCELNRDYESLQKERIEGATDLFSICGSEAEPRQAAE